MQFQIELLHSLSEFRPKLIGICLTVSGKVVARKRASNDADVSTTSPIVPYGGFSPVRLEGWLSEWWESANTAMHNSPQTRQAERSTVNHSVQEHQEQFDAHKCKRLDASQNAVRIVREATES
jgi:hypothetical protein